MEDIKLINGTITVQEHWAKRDGIVWHIYSFDGINWKAEPTHLSEEPYIKFNAIKEPWNAHNPQ
jgi:hypothetical protein